MKIELFKKQINMETTNNKSYLIINESDKNKFETINENVINEEQFKTFYSLYIFNKKITEELKDGTKHFDGVNISAVIWKFLLNKNDCLNIFKKIKNNEIINEFKGIYSYLIIIVIAAGVGLLGGYLNTFTWGKSGSGDIGETWKFIIWKGGTLLLCGAGFVFAVYSIFMFFKTLFSYIFLPLTNRLSSKSISEKKFKKISKLISEFLFFQIKDNHPLESKGNIKTFKTYSEIREKYQELYKLPEKYQIEYSPKRSDSTIKIEFKYKLFYLGSNLNEIFRNIPSDIKNSKENLKILVCNGNENFVLPSDIMNDLNKKPTKR